MAGYCGGYLGSYFGSYLGNVEAAEPSSEGYLGPYAGEYFGGYFGRRADSEGLVVSVSVCVPRRRLARIAEERSLGVVAARRSLSRIVPAAVRG